MGNNLTILYIGREQEKTILAMPDKTVFFTRFGNLKPLVADDHTPSHTEGPMWITLSPVPRLLRWLIRPKLTIEDGNHRYWEMRNRGIMEDTLVAVQRALPDAWITFCGRR